MASSNGLSKGEEYAEISEAELAQISEAFAHVAKGERTAQALESNLTGLEKKIDALLASFEESERLKVEEANSKLGNLSGEEKGDDNDEKVLRK